MCIGIKYISLLPSHIIFNIISSYWRIYLMCSEYKVANPLLTSMIMKFIRYIIKKKKN